MKNKGLVMILPIMFGFFVMGFVDIIGMTTNNIKSDFTDLNDTIVNLLASSCFIWFLLISVPTGMLMNKIGRKNTVLLSFIVQVIAFSIVLINYSFLSIMIALSLVGAGNTILQVALNPLAAATVAPQKLTGVLTMGQFVKAISSFAGPILVGWFSAMAFGWKSIFIVYAALSLLAFLWLLLTKVSEEKEQMQTASIGQTFGLFKDGRILMFFIGILVLVGVDVGMNITFPKYLHDTFEMSSDTAGMGNSVYFFARTVGSFLGGILLLKYAEKNFFIASVFLGFVGLVLMLAVNELWAAYAGVVLFGLGYSNLFGIIMANAIKHRPEKSNEISALLIMGVSGGGVLPPLMGVITDATGTQWAALLAIAVVWGYLFWLISKMYLRKSL
jgi:fucose permease